MALTRLIVLPPFGWILRKILPITYGFFMLGRKLNREFISEVVRLISGVVIIACYDRSRSARS